MRGMPWDKENQLDFVGICIMIYTVSHKKRATLFLIITLAFLGRFLYFMYQLKREEVLYNLLI